MLCGHSEGRFHSGPLDPADSAANLVTAHFCSTSGPSASVAYFLIDLTAGGHGKLRALAIDPADSSHVLRTNEVTYNGGVEGCYGPTVLRSVSDHTSERLNVSVIGSDFSSVTAMTVVGIDSLWSVPLMISSRSDSLLSGFADVPSLLPASQIEPHELVRAGRTWFPDG
jgi:hypothetical protein